MPPRLQLLKRAQVALPAASTYQPIAPFLYPCLQQQRFASILNSISDTPGAYNKRIRRGRGPSSGKGKTSGRGHKGQKQHGKVPVGFQGGQTPNWIVHGKKGFTNKFSTEINPVNLDTIQLWINKGRIDPSKPITIKELSKSKCVKGIKDGVKLLARGKTELTTPIDIVVSRASEEAIAQVEKLGGTVTSRYYTNFAVKKIVRGEMDPIHSLQSRINLGPEAQTGAETSTAGTRLDRSKYKYRLPDPTSRKNFEYYRDFTKRGYLSHTVAEGQGPSLFFRNPAAPPTERRKKVAGRATKLTKQQQEATRLW